MSMEREGILSQVQQEGEEDEGFEPSPPERQERIDVARQAAREGTEGEAAEPSPRPRPGEPVRVKRVPEIVARPTPTDEPLPTPRVGFRLPSLAFVAALAPAALAEPTPAGEIALAAAVVLVLLVEGGKAVLDALPKNAPPQEVLDEIERALRADRNRKEADAIIRDIERELERQRKDKPGTSKRARQDRARAAAVAVAQATPVRSTGDEQVPRPTRAGLTSVAQPVVQPETRTRGRTLPVDMTVTPERTTPGKPVTGDPTSGRTVTPGKPVTGDPTTPAIKTETKAKAAPTAPGRPVPLPRGFELPTGKMLPPGVFPKIVEFGQGIAVRRLNLFTGRVSSRKIRPGEAGSFRQFFRVVETSKVRPPRRTFRQGLFTQRVTRRTLVFRKRRGL